MEERGYLLFANGHKEYFEEGIQVLQHYSNRNDRDEIVEVRLPNSVKMIARDAFRSCANLRKVTCSVEDCALEHIGQNAFDSCEKLQEFDVPYSLRIVDAYAFGQTALHMMDLSHSYFAYLGEGAFILCKNLMKVMLPGSFFPIIYSHCFYDCENLMMVSGGYIKLVDENAFAGCASLMKGPNLDPSAAIRAGNDPLKALL